MCVYYIYMYIYVYIDFFANRGLKLQNKKKINELPPKNIYARIYM